jgi:holo-[acyl-carrier protein] synthase
MGRGIRFCDIETGHDANGKPVLSLAGGATTFLEAHGIRSVHLTISHTDAYATAAVVLER